MAYLDTSVLVAYLVPETYSAHAENALRDPVNYPLVLSAWTETELHSALGIKCRTGQISEEHRQSVLLKYRALRGHFQFIEIADADFSVATELLNDWRGGLRAGDALHLALARRQGCTLLSLDERLVQAGSQAGIAARCLR